MKTPWFRLCRMVAGVGLIIGTADHAKAAAPAGSVFLSVEKKTGPYTNQSKDAGKGLHYVASGYYGNYAVTGSTSTTNTQSNNVWYQLTLRNQGANPISGVTVTFHIYVKTTNADVSASTTNIQDVSAAMTLTLAAGESKELETPPVTRSVANTAKTEVDPKNYTGAIKSTTTSVTTDVIGYYMDVKINGQIVAKSMDPDDILDKVSNATMVAPGAAEKKPTAAPAATGKKAKAGN